MWLGNNLVSHCEVELPDPETASEGTILTYLSKESLWDPEPFSLRDLPLLENALPYYLALLVS